MTSLPGLPDAWGVTEHEWAQPMPGDDLAGPGWARLVRGVSCAAPPDRVWPWLCQLRVAPYSYDLLDNLGRRSPRSLTPGLPDLAVGQRIAVIFTVTDFVEGSSITMRARPGTPFGQVLMSYVVVPEGAGSRLLGLIRHPRHRGLAALSDRALAWGDLLMMRKQLRTLAGLAER